MRYWSIGILARVFANGPGDRGSILGRVIQKTQKMILDAFLLNTQHYKVQIKGKWSTPGKGVMPSNTPWYSNIWKGSHWVSLDYHHHLVPPARISLTFSHHSSLSFIASGRSSVLHPRAGHHVRGSIGEHHFWARSCFSNSVLYVWFV